MPAHPKGPLALSLLIIAIGVGWLLTALGYAPGINWIWVLSLGAAGVLVFVISGGVDKVSVVLGPFFLAASVLSELRQSNRITLDIEVPILVITVGVLLFIAQLRSVPVPRWFVPLPLETGTGKPE